MFLEYNIHDLWRSLERFKWWHNVRGNRELQYGFWNLPFKIHLHVYCLMFSLPVRKWIMNICGYWMMGQICSHCFDFLIYTGATAMKVRCCCSAPGIFSPYQIYSTCDMAFQIPAQARITSKYEDNLEGLLDICFSLLTVMIHSFFLQYVFVT